MLKEDVRESPLKKVRYNALFNVICMCMSQESSSDSTERDDKLWDKNKAPSGGPSMSAEISCYL